jgi:hypothetical protein
MEGLDMGSQTQNSFAKDFIKNSIESNYNALEKMIYDEAYKKAESDFKRKQKEKEDRAYKVVNGNTYVDLEYEVETNKRRFGFELNNIKQRYLEVGSLNRVDNGKYVPSEQSNIFVLIDGKLYMKQDELSILYLIYNEQRFVVKDVLNKVKMIVENDRRSILEHIYGISSVEYKQNSPLFQEIRIGKNK